MRVYFYIQRRVHNRSGGLAWETPDWAKNLTMPHAMENWDCIKNQYAKDNQYQGRWRLMRAIVHDRRPGKGKARIEKKELATMRINGGVVK